MNWTAEQAEWFWNWLGPSEALRFVGLLKSQSKDKPHTAPPTVNSYRLRFASDHTCRCGTVIEAMVEHEVVTVERDGECANLHFCGACERTASV